MAKNEYGLTPKQEVFAQEYLIDLNATAAAKRAGFSEKTANEQAAKMMANPIIKARVKALMGARGERTDVSSDDVVNELKKVAFGKMSDVAEWGGSRIKFKDSSQISEAADASIAELSETLTDSGGTLKIKKHDKIKALELLGKHLGMFKDKVEVSGKVTLEDLVAGSGEDEGA